MTRSISGAQCEVVSFRVPQLITGVHWELALQRYGVPRVGPYCFTLRAQTKKPAQTGKPALSAGTTILGRLGDKGAMRPID
jgi:hypothetical protein